MQSNNTADVKAPVGGSADHPRRIDRPCAWYSAELEKDRSWIWVMQPEHIEELDAALRLSKENGLAEQEVTKDNFPLSGFAKELDRLGDELEYGYGVVLMRGFPVDRYSHEDIRRIYWGIGAHIGNAESQNIKGELMQEITDLGFDYRKSEHRGSMTSALLRPHCDITDIVGLLCVRTAKSGGESTVRSSMTIYNEVLDKHPEYLPALHRGFHYELDGKGPAGAPDEVTHRVPVYSWHEGHIACRFNQKAIEAGATKSGSGLDALEQEAIDFIGGAAIRPDIELSMTFEPGDIQWLNNYVILHARSGFTDYEDPAKRRLLYRLWLNYSKARPLDDAFANKALSGPRKGVIKRNPTYVSAEMLNPPKTTEQRL